MGKKNINYTEIKKENNIMENVLNKYNPVLSSRDIFIENPVDNWESVGLQYTEEDHSYDDLGLKTK